MKTIFLSGLFIITLMAKSGFGLIQVTYQDDTTNTTEQIPHLDDLIEKSVEVLDIDQDYSTLVEDLIDLAAKPVNLNSAKEDELNSIPFLTPAQSKSLADYISTYGEVLSIYELQAIKGFDSVLIRQIRPFISISPPSHVPAPTPGNLFRFGHHDLLLRCEDAFPRSLGYLANDSARIANPGNYYPGNPQRYYFRYSYSWFDKLRIGIAGEKDPGEQFFQGAQPNGMDFYAMYLCLTNIGILKNLTIGNFRASFGQGLTMGSGLSLGSVPGFSTNLSLANGIRPSLGMSEGSYLKGLAATIKIKRVEITGFASYHPRDATITHIDSTSSIADRISAFSATGYHRTGLELAKRNALTELVCGGNINFSMAPTQELGFKIGMTGLFYKYSASISPEIHPYNQFGFRSDQNLNAGIDLRIRYHGMYFFGEISRSLNHGMAWLAGTIITPDPRACLTLIYRNYHVDYQNLYSNAFGQNSQNANERGIYAAITATVHPKLSLSGYLDLYSFPWLKYRVDMPTHSQELGVVLGWQASRNVMINFRISRKNSSSNGTTEPDQIIHKLIGNLARSYQLGIEWFPSDGILLKTRIQAKEVGESEKQRQFGYLVYQEVQTKALKHLKNITLRFALFDVPGYASRIYMYEPEVLYGYSVPAYQGRGTRTCLVFKFGIARRVDVWLRGGITCYSDRNEVGTGIDQTQGSVRGELTGQLLIKL